MTFVSMEYGEYVSTVADMIKEEDIGRWHIETTPIGLIASLKPSEDPDITKRVAFHCTLNIYSQAIAQLQCDFALTSGNLNDSRFFRMLDAALQRGLLATKLEGNFRFASTAYICSPEELVTHFLDFLQNTRITFRYACRNS